MNYSIITDLDALESFINNVLPESLASHEVFYVSLFARKKYAPEIITSSANGQLARFVSTKKNLIRKISQLEIPIGRYFVKDIVVPQEALALYIHPNPRNLIAATYEIGKKSWDFVRNDSTRIDIEALSAIQRAKSISHFTDFDIDTKDVKITDEYLTHIFGNEYHTKPYTLIETRGGYHLLVKPQYANIAIERYNKKRSKENLSPIWYKEILAKFPVEKSGDILLPVPGTYQGGFTPKVVA